MMNRDSSKIQSHALPVACVVVSAFCLFLIQPLMAKRILPVFGGSAAVWAVCLVFYQALLLGGYLYAHALASRLTPRVQGLAHAALTAAALLCLPQVGAPLSASGKAPDEEILLLLARGIGLPYLLLASTSPLLQAWRAAKDGPARVYRLFAWSNIACAVALLSFPFLLERLLPLSKITLVWQCAFGAAALLHTVCALQRMRSGEATAAERQSSVLRWHPLWFWLPLLGSGLLVSVTSYLTQVVAPFPLLWVLPLLLYLLSFVVVFEGDRYRTAWGLPVGFGGLLAAAGALVYLPPGHMMGLGTFVFSAGLFAACLMLHGELAARKPDAGRLTAFYVALAAGGAAGSLLTAIVAPMVFKYSIELPVMMGCAALTGAALTPRRRPLFDVAVAGALLIAASVAVEWVAYSSSTLVAERNFYGALRITQRPGGQDRPPLRAIVHGTVNHGAEYTEGEWRKVPLTYFHRRTAAGMLLSRESGPRRVGVVGLGAGTLAAYGRAGDVFRFYEINPLVVRMATKYFAYMNDSAAHVEAVLGDARVMMERERPQNYDVLLVDAFTGDSVPVHLLTREAFEVYLRHLKPGGTLALHVSNRYLDLPPVVRGVAQSLGLRATVVASQGDPETGAAGAVWVLVDRQRESKSATPPDRRLVWTDDFSSLLPVLR